MPGKNWFTFNLVNQQAFSQQVVIDIANQVRMSKVELFTLDIHNNLVQQAMHLQRSNNRSAKITVSAMSQLTLYVTIESASQLRSSVNIYSANEYIKAEHTSV
nr:7TM-DISM domain-containing protein [Colwellia maritima]